MVFYNDHQGLLPQEEKEPNQDKAYILTNEITNLRELNIKDFNYYLFSEDLDLMDAGEFEWWYRVAFKPWFDEIEENYFDINYEMIEFRFQSSEAKKLFVKKMIYFVMFYFPYQIVRDILKQKDTTLKTLITQLESTEQLISFRSEITDIIEKNMLNTEDFVQALVNFEKIAKKNQLDKSAELLDELVQNQNTFINIFKEIIYESDMEKILELLKVYYIKDNDNII